MPSKVSSNLPQKYKIVEVRRELWRLSNPIPLLKAR